MNALNLIELSAANAGYHHVDAADTQSILSLLKTRDFLNSCVFDYLSPSARRIRSESVLALANGVECSDTTWSVSTRGRGFNDVLKWFGAAAYQAMSHLGKIPKVT